MIAVDNNPAIVDCCTTFGIFKPPSSMTFLWYFVKTFESGHLKNDPSLNLHFYPFLTVLSAVVWDLQLLATTNLALSLWSYFNPKSCSPTKFSCRQRNGQQNTTWWTTIVICCMNIVAVFCYKSIYYYIGIIKAAIYQFNLPPVFSLCQSLFPKENF